MTWTYTNNPGGSSRDALRLAVGDTIENDPRLSDEEVEHFLSLYPDSLDLAAAEAAEAIAARYSSMAVSYVGDLDNSPHLKAEYYLKLARQLRSRAEVEEDGGSRREHCGLAGQQLCRPCIEEHCSNGE